MLFYAIFMKDIDRDSGLNILFRGIFMQYELYSKDFLNIGYSYHLSTNDMDMVLYYISKDKMNKNFIVIDNYDIMPINFSLLGFEQMPILQEHRKIILECKFSKHVDCCIEQGMPIEEINDKAINFAEKETDFYFKRIYEFD